MSAMPNERPALTEIEVRIAAAQSVGDIGDGWLTKNAQDMVRIAAFAGFDTRELVKRVAFATARGPHRMTNARTVERIMGEMEDEADRAAGVDPEVRRAQTFAALMQADHRDRQVVEQ